jgi:predicted transcriptional regulator
LLFSVDSMRILNHLNELKVLKMDPKEKAKMLAFVLWNEFNAKQVNIAKVLSVSEATISLWLKEMRFRQQIHQLTQELNEVRQIAQGLQSQGLIEQRQTFEVLQ